ncbi:MAG: DUF3769 domain-containing protein [Prochlorothrix sp.]|nr:DUF3769 domain-containing protein [Prochlorothrix sp.]
MIDFLYVPNLGPDPAEMMENVALVQVVADRPEPFSYAAVDLLPPSPGQVGSSPVSVAADSRVAQDLGATVPSSLAPDTLAPSSLAPDTSAVDTSAPDTPAASSLAPDALAPKIPVPHTPASIPPAIAPRSALAPSASQPEVYPPEASPTLAHRDATASPAALVSPPASGDRSRSAASPSLYPRFPRRSWPSSITPAAPIAPVATDLAQLNDVPADPAPIELVPIDPLPIDPAAIDPAATPTVYLEGIQGDRSLAEQIEAETERLGDQIDPQLSDPRNLNRTGSEIPSLDNPSLHDPSLNDPSLNDPSLNPPADRVPLEGVSPNNLSLIDLKADRQAFDRRRQIMVAEGNAFLRFNGGAIVADRIQYNVATKFVRAEGNVKFRRGQQRINGDYLEYNLLQERGIVEPATGQIFNAESTQDLDFGATPSQGLPADDPALLFPENPPLVQPRLVGETLITTGFGTSFGATDTTNGNPENVVAVPLEISNFRQTGTINHWRYQAERVDLLPDGWVADRAILSNDPFDPSQFRLRTNNLEYREITPLVSEIRADQPRYIFDNGLVLPTFRDRVLIDRRAQDAGLFSIGYEGNDRGGLFIERTFEPISRDNLRIALTPQFLLQKTLLNSATDADPEDPIPVLSSFALKGSLWAQIRSGTTVTGNFVATDLGAIGTEQFEQTFRGNLRLQQALPLRHILALEASYRDQLFNGSLGYQTIHSSLGAVLYSPTFMLGNSGVTLRYQGGLQFITADTDRSDLLKPVRSNNRVDLTRYQASVSLGRGFTLWQGEPLPATPTLGLRYTPVPITPNISLNTGLTGIFSGYSNGDTQESLTGSVGITGTFGHHSRRWFDFTQLNATYSRAIQAGESPFLFDRIADSQAIGVGIRQQIYGPIVVGFQTGVNLDTGEEFSRDYSLEYQRRAFNVALRYNPEREIGSLTFRLYDFAW